LFLELLSVAPANCDLGARGIVKPCTMPYRSGDGDFSQAQILRTDRELVT
jgi:hypothetical protein